jgi:hypothetical protein
MNPQMTSVSVKRSAMARAAVEFPPRGDRASRLRHPRSRADDLALLRRRLVAAPGAGDAPPAETEAALELRRLRVELSEALGTVSSCTRCAHRHPLPAGRWSGGHCCSGPTTGVFTDDEVAALRLSGTTPRSLTPPISDHAGCVFRGPTGCSIAPADRPNICVRYLCHDLTAELRERGDLARIRALAADIKRTFDRFVALRAARS